VLDLAPAVRELIRECPVARVETPTGDEAWLVTGYAQVKSLFTDERLGRSHPDPPSAPRASHFFLNGGPTGDFATELADLAQTRRLLSPAFTPRRMRLLRDRIEQIADELLDAAIAYGPPVDLHAALSYPLPLRVICELLGLPGQDRAMFQEMTGRLDDIYDAAGSEAAFETLRAYLLDHVARKRLEPGEDFFSDLISKDIDTDQIVLSGVALLFAGHATTAAHIDFGTLFLLLHPDVRAALAADPAQIPAAVEELLRIAPLGTRIGLLRYAREDLRCDSTAIRAGEAVLLMSSAANHDPAAFPDPDRFDPQRTGPAHLTFGLGPRFCLGANLARVELEVACAALLRRFPTLRLAEPVADLELSTTHLFEGLVRLPVTW
jgi:pentalenolactone synthase